MTGNGQHSLTKIAEQANQAMAPEAVRAAPPDNFIAQVQSTVDMLARTGVWLGKLGAHDAKEVHAFADHWRQEVLQFIGDLIERKRKELAELERIVGRLGSNK